MGAQTPSALTALSTASTAPTPPTAPTALSASPTLPPLYALTVLAFTAPTAPPFLRSRERLQCVPRPLRPRRPTTSPLPPYKNLQVSNERPNPLRPHRPTTPTAPSPHCPHSMPLPLSPTAPTTPSELLLQSLRNIWRRPMRAQTPPPSPAVLTLPILAQTPSTLTPTAPTTPTALSAAHTAPSALRPHRPHYALTLQSWLHPPPPPNLSAHSPHCPHRPDLGHTVSVLRSQPSRFSALTSPNAQTPPPVFVRKLSTVSVRIHHRIMPSWSWNYRNCWQRPGHAINTHEEVSTLLIPILFFLVTSPDYFQHLLPSKG